MEFGNLIEDELSLWQTAGCLKMSKHSRGLIKNVMNVSLRTENEWTGITNQQAKMINSA